MLNVEIKDRIGLITLNRPEKRNAFNAELVGLLHDAVQRFNTDAEIAAILIKSNGEAFSAGADLAYLQELQTNTLDENYEDSKKLGAMFESIYHSPKLTVSAVEGYALAGGCGLASVTDFCFATHDSRFGFTEVKIGFIPALVSVYLQRKLTESDLKKLLLTGCIISAERALEIGLISHLMEEGQDWNHVFHELSIIVSTTSGQAVSSTKQLLRDNASKKHSKAIEQAAMANAKARATDDCKRGIAAFLNKEKLNW